MKITFPSAGAVFRFLVPLACSVILLLLVVSDVNAAADLYIKDTPADTGVEPNPDPGPMWISEDIWVRTSPDPGYLPYAFPAGSPPWVPLAHQNPEYRDPKYSVPNYVYVRVRNRGTTASTGTERLRVYWAKASTGLAWPAHWVDYMANNCGPSKLYGIELTKPRKNAGNATAAERNAYRNAITNVGTMLPYQFSDGVSYWHKQNSIHTTPPPMAHGSPGFAPWHREYLNRYEILLQQFDPLVRLMYWDWTTDPENTTGGVNLFTTSFMGVSGRGSGGTTLGLPFDSLFAPTISRNLSTSVIPPAQVDSTVLLPAGYTAFRSTLENSPNHNSTHGYIGGGGNISFIPTAAQDPFFFMLHGNVDRLWAQWQRNVTDVSRLDPATTYGTSSGNPHITGNMPPWDGSSSLVPWTIAGGYIVSKNSKNASVVFPPIYDVAPLVVPVLQPGEAVVIQIPWYPPNPADFACFGDPGHFCLLSRIETATASPFGMTTLEGANVSDNTRNNNNIAWKNLTVVDSFAGAFALSSVLIRNVFAVRVPTTLRLTARGGGFEPTFLDYGRAYLNIGPKLYNAWLVGGSDSKGVESLGQGRFQIFSPDASLGGILVEPQQAEPVEMQYELDRDYRSPGGQQIMWDLYQLGSPNKPDEIVGGQVFAADFNKLCLIKAGSNWRYLDGGKDPGTDWYFPNYDDRNWKNGQAELGYEDDPRTVIDGGPRGDRHITAYFRHSFNVVDPTFYRSLWLRLKRDDGARVFLNGEQIHLVNLPAGVPVTPATLATRAVEGLEEDVFVPTAIPNALGLLRRGRNVLAVEVHQDSPRSPDLSFDLELCANLVQTRFLPEVAVTEPPDGALLQLGQNANLAAEALDFDGPIRRLEFYGDGQLLNTDTDPPYTGVWQRPGLGRHRVRVVAYDGDNLSSTAFATFSVISNLPPNVQITSPSNVSVYLVGQDIPLAALASDPGGKVQTVEFYSIPGHDFVATEQLLAKVAAAPYSVNLPSPGVGSYRFFARAIDDGGLATDSNQQHVHVEPALPGPRLEIQWMGQQLLMLTWDVPGAVLETAEKLTGQWTPMANAKSPHHILPSDPARYFRLRLPPGQ